MTLREYISAQGWLALPTLEVHRRMNEIVVGQSNDTPITFAGVADSIGPAYTTDLLETLTVNGLGWCNYQLGGAGLRLSDQRVQEVLRSFEAAGKPWAKPLRLLGRNEHTRYEHHVGSGECTLEMVEAALNGN